MITFHSGLLLRLKIKSVARALKTSRREALAQCVGATHLVMGQRAEGFSFWAEKDGLKLEMLPRPTRALDFFALQGGLVRSDRLLNIINNPADSSFPSLTQFLYAAVSFMHRAVQLRGRGYRVYSLSPSGEQVEWLRA